MSAIIARFSQPVRQGSSGALTNRRIEARSAEVAPRSGPRRAPDNYDAGVIVIRGYDKFCLALPEAPSDGCRVPGDGVVARDKIWQRGRARNEFGHGPTAGGGRRG